MLFIRKYFGVILLGAAMAVICAAALIYTFVENNMPFQVISFQDAEYQLKIKPHYNEVRDKYYLFLPSYTDKSKIMVQCEDNVSVSFSTVGIPGGASFEELPLLEDIFVTVRGAAGTMKATMQILQCENLPGIFVETKSGTLDYVHFSKDNEEEAAAAIVYPDGFLEYMGKAKLSGRGNGTWVNEKKAYNLELPVSISLGPFEAVTDLCLLAEYNDDSKMRNAAAYYLGAGLGIPYASDYTYCELYINGEFHGLYGVVTKKEYINHIQPDGIQAVFEISSGVNTNQFVSSMDKRISVIYGSVSMVQDRVNQFEEALRTQDWTQCARYVDFSSFAQKYAFEEWIANSDLTHASQYYYIGSDGMIRCMLPWDYDWSLGSAVGYFNELQETQILAYRSSACWYTYLLNCREFTDEVVKQLENSRGEDPLGDLAAYTASLADTIETDRAYDALRWDTMGAPGYIASGMVRPQEFADFFCSFLEARREFLMLYFSDPAQYCCIELRYNGTSDYINICVPRGEAVSRLFQDSNYMQKIRVYEDFLGFYTEEGAALSDVDAAVGDMVFYPRHTPSGEVSRSELMELLEIPVALLGRTNVAFILIFGGAFLLIAGVEFRRCFRRKAVSK